MHQAYFVYKITCSVTNKSYIGISSDPTRRLRQHRHKARTSNGGYALHAAMRKHGIENFHMSVIAEVETQEAVFELEKQLIQEHKTVSPHGYNICLGGENGPSGQEHSEFIKKMWASKSEEEMKAFKIKMKDVGADISDETRTKRSEAAKAQHQDLTKKQNTHEALLKANQNPELRKSRSEAAKARWADPEFIAKMKNKYNTPEQREKKANAAKARWAARA